MTEEKWFPIQGEHPNGRGPEGPNERPPGCVPWGIAAEAFKVYSRKYHNGQSLERLAERGGFGWSELVALLRDDDNYPTIHFAAPDSSTPERSTR